jgi:glucokinase/N-acetylglucosamine kinase
MIIGVDVGGTNIDIVAFDGEFEHVATYSTKDEISKLNDILNDLIAKFNVKAVGIGLAAWIKKGKIIKMPNISGEFKISLKVPTIFDNDANCFAFYSAKYFGFKNVIGITVGTGIGSGIVLGGKLIKGEGLAGEIGHWFVGGNEECTCGGKGHLEAYFGGWSIKKRFGKPAEDLFKDGSIYKVDGLKMLCVAVANAVTLLDPEAVVFGGRIGGNLDVNILKDEIYRYLMDVFKPEILTLKDPLAVAKGACLLVKENDPPSGTTPSSLADVS